MGEMKIHTYFFTGNRSLTKPKHGKDDNIKMDIQGIWCEVLTGFDWLWIGPRFGLL
jgi:hypothetical protein